MKILRPIVKQDLEILNNWRNDIEIFRYLGGGFNPISMDQQYDWMSNFIDNTGNNRRYMIINEEQKPIGMIGLYNIQWSNRNAELGIYIGDKSSHGKGFGQRALAEIESFGFNYLNLLKIKVKTVESNRKAIAFFENQGYEQVGKLYNERFIDGNYHHVILFEKFRNGEKDEHINYECRNKK